MYDREVILNALEHLEDPGELLADLIYEIINAINTGDWADLDAVIDDIEDLIELHVGEGIVTTSWKDFHDEDEE